MEEKKIENVTQGAGTAGGSWYDSLGNKPKSSTCRIRRLPRCRRNM